MTTSSAAKPPLHRRRTAALTPDIDDSLLNAAATLLAPLRETLDRTDLASLDGVAPALRFDPYTAGGPPTWLSFPLPEPPPLSPPEVPTADLLPWTSAADLSALIRAGRLSPVEVVDAFLTRISTFDARLGAFLTITAEQARERAQVGGFTGPLAGVPVGLKDLIEVAGISTTCGSPMFADRVTDRDATCWTRLRDAGAILLGKLATQEFAAGVTGANDHFGSARNPWNAGRITGGSSVGSAVAVAVGMLPVALGTDTGGSIRIPAGCCGTVGLKPTYGRVPTDGVYPLSWTLDHIGPLARTVRDAGLALDVLASTRCEQASRAGAAHRLTGVRVGVPRRWLVEVQPAVAATFDAALGVLERLGAELVEVTALPDLDELAAINRVIAYAEGSAVHEQFLSTQPGYGPTVRPRMEAGRLLVAGQYLTAQRLRTVTCTAFAAVWRDIEVLATPVLPCTAPPVGSTTVGLPGRVEPVATALIRLTGPANLTGLPALTVPSGLAADGLPTGLQLLGPPGEEERVCFVGAAYEATTDHRLCPPGFRG